MITCIEDNMHRIIVLDISCIYTQIHDQGYFDINSMKEIQKQYSDKEHWLVIVLD